ncbi:MAG: molybdenum cofactor guanylyltransferase [Candidatus Delongbacteria bacterium]|jgi:molybdopterin-guanine dinucleotide biosynthesis protein A|nr:molybdenum cofactor guanylyltransferase [Candidatus Delongbacteria bacterium]
MTNIKENIACAILAGGKSKRMNGVNKAMLEVGSCTNLEKILRLSDKFFSEIIIVSDEKNLCVNDYKIIRVSDIFKNIGPLGGIHAALTVTTKQAVFFFPGDMPFIDEKLVESEIKKFFSIAADIIVPKMGEMIEPLHSIYSSSLKEQLEEYLTTVEDLAIRKFYADLNVFYWELEQNEHNKKAFFNINTFDDLETARKNNKLDQ